MVTELKDFVIGLIFLAAIMVGLVLFGIVFHAYLVPFTMLWVAIPMLAVWLCRPSGQAFFTLRGLRGIQVALMTSVILLSFFMFANVSDARNRVGRRFVGGYHHWVSGPYDDDDGHEYYEDEWTAKNSSGVWALRFLVAGIWTCIFGLPVITYYATRAAIDRKEMARVLSQDEQHAETHEPAE